MGFRCALTTRVANQLCGLLECGGLLHVWLLSKLTNAVRDCGLVPPLLWSTKMATMLLEFALGHLATNIGHWDCLGRDDAVVGTRVVRRQPCAGKVLSIHRWRLQCWRKVRRMGLWKVLSLAVALEWVVHHGRIGVLIGAKQRMWWRPNRRGGCGLWCRYH